MGYETTCRARVNDGRGVREAESKVLLETDDLIVRGDARVTIPRASIQKLAIRGSVLTVTSPNAVVSLTLGADAAARWRTKLAEAPKRLIDKLDIKPGATVWMVGQHDATLTEQLAERTERVSTTETAAGCDAVSSPLIRRRTSIASTARRKRSRTPARSGSCIVRDRRGSPIRPSSRGPSHLA